MNREPIRRFFIYCVDAVEIKCNKNLLADCDDNYDSGEGEVEYNNDWIDIYSTKIRETVESLGYDSSEYIDVDFEEESITFYYLNGDTELLTAIDCEDMYIPDMSEGDYIKVDSIFIEHIKGEKVVKNIVNEGDEIEIIKKVYNFCDNSIDYYIKRFEESERNTTILDEDSKSDKEIDLLEDDLSGSSAFKI